MKHEIQTTETFTRVRYTCDVCGEELLAGQRPTLCEICGREICSRGVFSTCPPAERCVYERHVSGRGHRSDDPICRFCMETETGALTQMDTLMLAAYHSCEDIRKAWKQRSLQQEGTQMLILNSQQAEKLRALGIETAEDLEQQIATADWGWLMEIYVALEWIGEEPARRE